MVRPDIADRVSGSLLRFGLSSGAEPGSNRTVRCACGAAGAVAVIERDAGRPRTRITRVIPRWQAKIRCMSRPAAIQPHQYAELARLHVAGWSDARIAAALAVCDRSTVTRT